MGLSCDCGYDDWEWFFEIPDQEFSANSSGQCYGCFAPIKIGDDVRHIAGYEIDADGNEKNWRVEGRLCENCSGLYDRFVELGFCITAERGFIKQCLLDYQDLLPSRHILRTD